MREKNDEKGRVEKSSNTLKKRRDEKMRENEIYF